MLRLRRHRRFASLFALLAVLAFALVPTLSRALAAGPGTPVEVCTPQGLQRLPLDAPAAPAHVDACALCALGGADVLPVPLGAALALPGLAAVAPALPDGPVPAWRRVWWQAPPRAPPSA